MPFFTHYRRSCHALALALITLSLVAQNNTLLDAILTSPEEDLVSLVAEQVSTTQTSGHLKTNFQDIVQRFGNHINASRIKKKYAQKLQRSQAIQGMLSKLHQKEQEEQAKGNYTFVHAQQWKWHFLADLFKELWQIKYGTAITDYQFLRFFSQENIDIQQEALYRKTVMSGGRDYDNRPQLLFMNHAIFGNTNNAGSCSLGYFLKNDDMSYINITPYNLFVILGLEHIYKSVEQDVQELEQLHKESSNLGNMLLLSFTPEQLRECVYAAQPGGDKKMVSIHNHGQTDNVTIILDTLKHNPQLVEDNDYIEYCMVLTKDLALNPHKGPRIFAFNTADSQIYHLYENKRNELVATLRRHLGITFIPLQVIPITPLEEELRLQNLVQMSIEAAHASEKSETPSGLSDDSIKTSINNFFDNNKQVLEKIGSSLFCITGFTACTGAAYQITTHAIEHHHQGNYLAEGLCTFATIPMIIGQLAALKTIHHTFAG